MTHLTHLTHVHHLLAELASRGVTISVEGTRLRFRPRAALTEGLIARLLAAKPELLALVRTIQSPAVPPASVPPGAAPSATAPPTAAPSLPPLQWWVLWAVAHSPRLPRAALYACLPAPRPAVDLALSALLRRYEVQADRDGGLDLNVS